MLTAEVRAGMIRAARGRVAAMSRAPLERLRRALAAPAGRPDDRARAARAGAGAGGELPDLRRRALERAALRRAQAHPRAHRLDRAPDREHAADAARADRAHREHPPAALLAQRAERGGGCRGRQRQLAAPAAGRDARRPAAARGADPAAGRGRASLVASRARGQRPGGARGDARRDRARRRARRRPPRPLASPPAAGRPLDLDPAERRPLAQFRPRRAGPAAALDATGPDRARRDRARACR